jgi:hypothetical protein
MFEVKFLFIYLFIIDIVQDMYMKEKEKLNIDATVRRNYAQTFLQIRYLGILHQS